MHICLECGSCRPNGVCEVTLSTEKNKETCEYFYVGSPNDKKCECGWWSCGTRGCGDCPDCCCEVCDCGC